MKTESHAKFRSAEQPPNALTPATLQWLKQLPTSVRPMELPLAYGRIANSLQETWSRPSACLEYLNELVLDRRGARLGFPGAIALEIAALKDYYETNVHASRQTTWDHIRAHARPS